MQIENALAKYGSAVSTLKEYQAGHGEVFKENMRLTGMLIDAENELRDAVAESGQSVSNGMFKVVITPQTQTFADIEVIDKLIAEGKIHVSLREQIVKTVQRPARISISEIKLGK